MRAPTNHTKPHISSITISVHNQLTHAPQSCALSFIVSLNDPHTPLYRLMFGSLSSPPQYLYSNSFSGALPTQIGQLTQMSNDMVSQGPSTNDNDKDTDTIDESSYQSHGATHLFHHHHRAQSTHAPQSCALSFIVSLNDQHTPWY